MAKAVSLDKKIRRAEKLMNDYHDKFSEIKNELETYKAQRQEIFVKELIPELESLGFELTNIETIKDIVGAVKVLQFCKENNIRIDKKVMNSFKEFVEKNNNIEKETSAEKISEKDQTKVQKQTADSDNTVHQLNSDAPTNETKMLADLKNEMEAKYSQKQQDIYVSGVPSAF